MKNKHLVLLFIITLLVGLAVRRAPWRDAVFFQANLLKLDTAELQQIQITLPEHPPLFLLRGDAGWAAEQSDRSVTVPPDAIQQMLEALADLRSIRIAKTERADTLGFTPNAAIHLALFQKNNQQESLTLGWESIEGSQPSTYVQLPKHEGIYLVNNHLRNVFSKSLNDFRKLGIAQFSLPQVCGFSILRQNMDSLFYQKNDSSGMWKRASFDQALPDDSVQIWLAKIARLKNLPFADLYDESHANGNFFAQISLVLKGQTEPLTLKIFRSKQTNVPEEMPTRKPDRRPLAPFVLHSSQNHTNYFALSDTALLRQICQPF